MRIGRYLRGPRLEARPLNEWDRGGMTLVEAIVVLGIISVLAAVLLPAVQRAREASRRVSCISNLGQFGRAIQTYQAIRRVFPAAIPPPTIDGQNGLTLWFSPHAQVLPYVEQISLSVSFDWHQNFTPVLPDPWTSTQKRVALPLFVCPSDGGAAAGEPFNSIRVCTGPTAYGLKSPLFSPDGGRGAFVLTEQLSPADFLDGLSNTIGASEKIVGQRVAAFSCESDFRYSGVSNLGSPGPGPDLMAAVCDSLGNSNASFSSYAGSAWCYGGYEFTWYNHVLTPNSTTCDCSVNGANTAAVPSNGGAFRATSYHPGGVNCLLMDGSVKFALNGVSLQVWRALASRAGGDGASFGELQ